MEEMTCPPSISTNIRTEEELESYIQKTTTVSHSPITSDADKSEPSSNLQECTSCGIQDVSSLCQVCERSESIATKRKASHAALTDQAKRMKLASDRNFPNPIVGDAGRVQVPDVDRGKTDARSVLACVMEITADNFFKLGTRNGILKQLYSRSQFEMCHERFLRVEEIPTEIVSLRSVASSQAQGNGQGYVRCQCTMRCNTKKCLCRRSGILCNSKCHNSNSCTNK